jgi:CheY-like chemotaxis protein
VNRPARDTPAIPPRPREAAEAAPAAARPLRVLVADPLAGPRHLVATGLIAAGHDCEIAADGPAAVAALRRGTRFAALVLALDAPGLDGLALLRALRADREAPWLARLPAVGIAAVVVPGMPAVAAAAGLDALLQRPIAIPELLTALAEAVAFRTPPPALDPARRVALRAEHGAEALRARDATALALALAALDTLQAARDRDALAEAAEGIAAAFEGIGAPAVVGAAREIAAAQDWRAARQRVPALFSALIAARMALLRPG